MPDSGVDVPPEGSADVQQLPHIVLVIGDEEFLVARAVEQITAAARRLDPDTDVDERAGGQIEPAELFELLSPSLFGSRRLLVISAAQDLRAADLAALTPFLDTRSEDTTVVLLHAGGAKGKAVLETARRAGAREIVCSRPTRAEERLDFVRGEVRRAGGSITPDAAASLLDAVGSDLRELSQAAAQLVADSNGRITAATVTAYYRGRAEVTGFAVSDRAVVGDAGGALETLRWALSIGTPAVVVADAMADGVRSVARISAAGRGNTYQLAQRLGMPPWKVKRAQSQARGWTDRGLHQALQVVAELNADVKGAAVDAEYALERAVLRLAQARTRR
jgi:DNA polymerase III subunit delta